MRSRLYAYGPGQSPVGDLRQTHSSGRANSSELLTNTSEFQAGSSELRASFHEGASELRAQTSEKRASCTFYAVPRFTRHRWVVILSAILAERNS